MLNRRAMLGAMMIPAGAGLAARRWFDAARLPGSLAASAALEPPPGEPDEVARDEAFWAQVAAAFPVDRSLVNLNNGGVSPSPALVLEAQRRHIEFSNQAPAYTMWRILEPQREAVRQRLARAFGAEAEEIAVTRNASESLQACQMGFDLAPGDEVLTTTQDYPRMLTAFRQRARRQGVVLRTFSIPTPAEDGDAVVELFRRNITPRTRLILACHVINLTGQILPVAAIVELARQRGVPVIVDGAHALAHFPFDLHALGCDFYGSSLHKWLFAPHGTGLLYVRRERIGDLWPLMAAEETQKDDIRKFEEIGTHPAAGILAIAEALTFHELIGPARKAARLVHLRDAWARRLLSHQRVRLHTSLRPGLSCGIATVQIEGIESGALCEWLWSRHRILVTGIKHEEFEGIRVSPSVYTTLPELDRFCDAMEYAIERGIG
jgi:selenocysteine lyase/cysteine desulfurase